MVHSNRNVIFTSFFPIDSRDQKQGSNLRGIALDEENGMIYTSDINNHVIWKMTTEGKDLKILTGQKGKHIFYCHLALPLKTHYFGKTGIKGYEDGSAENARLDNPFRLGWIDKRTLVCAELGNHIIRSVSIGKTTLNYHFFDFYFSNTKLNPHFLLDDGNVTTLAGQGAQSGHR